MIAVSFDLTIQLISYRPKYYVGHSYFDELLYVVWDYQLFKKKSILSVYSVAQYKRL